MSGPHPRRDPATAPVPAGSALKMFCQTILILEAFVLLFAGLTAFGLKLADPAVIAGVTAATIVAVIFSAWLVVRAPKYGLIAGSIAQLLVLLVAWVIPEALILGLSFLALWIASIWFGRKLDAERDVRREEQRQWELENPTEGEATAAQ